MASGGDEEQRAGQPGHVDTTATLLDNLPCAIAGIARAYRPTYLAPVSYVGEMVSASLAWACDWKALITCSVEYVTGTRLQMVDVVERSFTI